MKSVEIPILTEEYIINFADHPRQNHLINALPPDVFARLKPHLEPVNLALGDVLYEADAASPHIYFPISSIVSLLYAMENGASTEVAAVGKEGLVGIALFMGGETMPNRAVVESAGHGYRLKPRYLKEEMNKGGPVLQLLLRYTQALITQMSQTAVCNRYHSLDQQLCRRLLISVDRLQTNELMMTQELLSNMLGVRREGVTEAAGKLQRAGLIQYSRGRITILNRAALEERVCECYGVVKKEFDRLLPASCQEHHVHSVAKFPAKPPLSRPQLSRAA